VNGMETTVEETTIEETTDYEVMLLQTDAY